MKKLPDALRIFLFTLIISLCIVSIIKIQESFDKMYDHMKAQRDVISQLQYDLLHCRLSTIIEIKEKKDDQERIAPKTVGQKDP